MTRQNAYEREMKVLKAVERMKKDGIYFDGNKFQKTLPALKAREDSYKKDICRDLGSDINIASPEQLKVCLKNRGYNINDTSDGILAQLESKDPVFRKIREWRKLEKIISCGQSILEQVHGDGRLHPNWISIGAKTGRMSCKDPNVQSFSWLMRKLCTALHNRMMVSGDYKQIELCIAAEIIHDENMCRDIENKIDIHEKITKILLKKDTITDKERSEVKACVFGVLYGMGPQGIQNKVASQFGRYMTLDEAIEFRTTFLNLYPGIQEWHKVQKGAEKIVSLGGRVWTNINKPPEEGWINRYNYPIQSSGAEGLKEALILLESKLPIEWRLCAAVHDEILLEVPETCAEDAEALLRSCMECGMKQLLKRIPVMVKTKISEFWEK